MQPSSSYPWPEAHHPDRCPVTSYNEPSLGRLYIRGALHRQHQLWLEGLARVASAGLP